MLAPEQLKELKTRVGTIAKEHGKIAKEVVKQLKKDFDLILDMRDSPEKTAMEQRFMVTLVTAEKYIGKGL